MKFKKKARFNKLESPEPLAWKKYHWILLNIYSLQTPVRTYVLKLWYMLKISVDTSCRHTFNRKRSLLWKTDEVFSADYKLMVYIKIPLVKPRDAKACSCSLYQAISSIFLSWYRFPSPPKGLSRLLPLRLLDGGVGRLRGSGRLAG